MVKSKKAHSDKKKKMVFSAGRRVNEKKNSGSNYVNVPPDYGIFRVKEDKIFTISVLPTIAGKNTPFAKPGKAVDTLIFKAHKDVFPGGGGHLCLRMKNKRCPTCERVAELAREDAKANKEFIDGAKAKERQLVLLRTKAEGLKPLVWENSTYLFNNNLDDKIRKNKEEHPEYEFYFDPSANGFDLEINPKESSFKGGKSYMCADIQFVRRKKALEKADPESFVKLEDMLVWMTTKEIDAMYAAGDEDEEEDKKKKKKKKPVDDEEKDEESDDDEESDEDEDSDDEESDEEEEEDEKPKKKKPADDDDEDEEEDSEEEDEDEDSESEDDEEESDDEEDDEDDSESEDDEEDDEEESDDDEDEEDSEEDEEEEKPKRKSKTTKKKGKKSKK